MSDDVVGKLARPPLLRRLFGAGRQPLRLIAVPRDHVIGDRVRGDALLSGRMMLGSQTVSLADVAAFRGSREQDDDVTLVVCRLT